MSNIKTEINATRAIVLETERLVLRRLCADDADFIIELLNQPSFLRYIGDKGVRNAADAVEYIQSGPVASYERFGFGLYLVQLKDSEVPVGMCGLLKRDSLPDVDVGFAFLPSYWSQGFAFEAAMAVVNYGREAFGLKRIVAITSLDNAASIKLLERMGFHFEGLISLGEDQAQVRLFASAS
ncbi:MAG TPA: GNAT family N-acetyltransferase [Pyrinomonadaceae bacterium]|jgi:RimJ/RimL family protein N-acetyltransferase|nr:GNAT family N-acetyltransferase [Pyrinomonadaceae bacterium]